MKKIYFPLFLFFFHLICSNQLLSQNAAQLIDTAVSLYQSQQFEKSYQAFSRAYEINNSSENQGFNFYCFSVAAEECGKTTVANQYLEKALKEGIAKSFVEINYIKENHPLYKKKKQAKIIDSLLNFTSMNLLETTKKDSLYFLHLQDTALKINSNENLQTFLNKLKSAKVSINSLLDSLEKLNSFPVPPKTDYFAMYFSSDKTEKVPYILFIPKNYDPQDKHELYVYLHGGTVSIENFTFTEEHAKEEPIFKWAKNKNILILYPLGKKTFGWHEGDEPIKNVYAMVDQVRNLYNINDNGITFIGMSNGARGAIYTALNNPKYFKNFFAISSSPQFYDDTLLLNNLTNCYSLNLMHGTADEVYPYNEHLVFLNKPQAKKLNLTMNTFNEGEHGFIYTDSGYTYFCDQLDKKYSSSIRSTDNINWTFDPKKESEYRWLKTTPSTATEKHCTIYIDKSGNNYFIKSISKSTDKVNIVIQLLYKQIDLAKPVCIYDENNKKIFEQKIVPDKEKIIRYFQKNMDRNNIVISEIALSL